ncbi:TRAP transporter large permease subunit [Rossellomorea sp. SC111]|uniref:TRAP transporter large permease subunit n=1 Tax=Rossellomorea sp. SC111 TaxID=2968985 RepID=UPI002811C0EC|nr:TRAP transporter large permease subunit [Rossellomorea sp. SC111]
MIIIAFFLFVGTFMDAIPAMILFVPVILPTANLFGMEPVHLGLIVVMTLAIGLVTPPYGLCLLLAAKIGKLSIEKSFSAVMPYILIVLVVLLFVAFLPEVAFYLPKLINPSLF